MSEFKEVFQAAGNVSLQVVNRDSDPIMWIVYIYKKILFFKKNISSHWFYSKEEARKFAQDYIAKDN